MLTWSTSSTKPNAFRNAQSKAAEEFLDSWDGAVYDEKPMNDPELSKEAALWRNKFPHLRVVGKCCEEHKMKTQKILKNQSKSALTFREKSREPSLPRIEKLKKKK